MHPNYGWALSSHISINRKICHFGRNKDVIRELEKFNITKNAKQEKNEQKPFLKETIDNSGLL